VNSINPDELMCYVAEDPEQPGNAWAMCVDGPRWTKLTAKDIARWVSKGAIVRRVTKAEASEMLKKWVRHE